jgi:hypothetical protein
MQQIEWSCGPARRDVPLEFLGIESLEQEQGDEQERETSTSPELLDGIQHCRVVLKLHIVGYTVA